MAMSHSEGQRILNLTVAKIEGLSQHKNRKYYVKCTVGTVTGDTRTVKQEVGATDIEWNQNFSFAVDDDSKLLLRLLLSRSRRDEEYGRIELGLTDIQFGQDVHYSLTKTNGSTSRSTSTGITIRCRWATQLEAVESIVNDTAETAQNHISQSNKLCDSSGTLFAGKSVAASWGRFTEKLALFNKIVTTLSDIHPYAKAALSIIKGLTDVFVKQTKRDDKIVSLVETMRDTFDLIHEGEPLNEGEIYKKIFKTMALQTIECGYFIQAYLKDGFCKRAVRSLNPRIDKAIDDFRTQFKEIQSSLKSHTALDTAVQVYRMIDTVQNLNATINLNEIAYAEGMRFKLESCCLPDTREEILDDIIEWVSNTETENRVFILTGLAGSGKSSIAHSVASYFKSLDRLGSSFFCSRSNLVNSRPDKIFSTIARDLADQNEQIQQNLIEVVKMNKSLGMTRSVREQFQDLIKKATDGLTMIGPLVIVIDALDECEGEDRLRRELMRILAQEASTLPKNFRIFLTSRSSNMYVEEAFGMNSSVVLNGVVHRELLERVCPGSTYHDIFLFVGQELSGVASGWIKRYPDWQAILTNESGGLFIWASTACKFIRGSSDDRGTRPIERYEQLQNLRSLGFNVGGTKPLEGVYVLYTSILMNIFKPENTIVMDRFRKVLGIVVTAYTTLSTNLIDELLNEDNVGRTIISELGSLLIGWDNTKLPVQVLHASFPEYLTNRDFSSHFYIDNKYRHSQMAVLCLKLMNAKLKFDICGFGKEDPHILYDDIPTDVLENKKQDNISEALQYACQYWAMHIVQIDPDDYGSIKNILHDFLFEGKHLLQWVEVLSILKYVDGVKTSLRALLKWTKRIKEAEPMTHSLIYDCCRFLEGFTHPITLSPLHVYLSAIPYVPTDTALYHLYSRASDLEPRVVFGPEKWSLQRSELPVDNDVTLTASAFSPDGSLVACAIKNGKVQLYDFATSTPREGALQLKTSGKNGEEDKQNEDNEYGEGDENGGECEETGDRDRGNSKDNVDDSLLHYVTIALSPDCSKIAVSHPKVIEVRDISTGVHIHCEDYFRTHEMKIPVTFQSNDVVIACRPNGTDVEIWKLKLDSMEASVCTFAALDDVVHVILSPNGAYVGCMSIMRTVSVWKVDTQKQVAQFNVPSSNEVRALGVSSSGNYVAVAYGEQIAMWSRGSVIWNESNGLPISEILMPLSTECSHFVTNSGGWNDVWDMNTGECRWHESKYDEALAISPDGRFLVIESGAIYSVNADKDEPDWEPSSDTRVNKACLEEDEYLKDVIVLPNGTVIAAGNIRETVFVWDHFGEADAAKQLLEAHDADLYDVKIAPGGMKLAGRDSNNNVLVWTRAINSTEFKPLKEYKFENKDAAEAFLNGPSQWMYSEDSETSDPARIALASCGFQIELNSVEAESKVAKRSAEGSFFIYKEGSEWVTTVEGKKLWWILEGFRGELSSQRGHTIVVYENGGRDSVSAILFKYANNIYS